VKRRSYFFVAFSVGKWTQATCRLLLGDVADRVALPRDGERIQFFSDGNDDYTYVLLDHFNLANLDYGQLVKIKEKGTLVGKEKRIIYGSPDLDDIETTDVENFNGILRERVGRLVRRSKCYSKLRRRLSSSLQFFLFYWDFMSQIRRGVSPAMLEGLADTLWTWRDFFYSRLSHTN
jgi:hypothetical protein